MHRRTLRRTVRLFALSALLCAASATAAEPSIPFERYTLPNGLEVILHQDRTLPLVAVDVWYHVGSGDETPGRSGFAHLFEHMMFQGSKHAGEDAHFDVLKKVGVSNVNGTTNADRTNYYEVVPSHTVETALWLESDRMGYLFPLLTQKSFDNQRDVVRNERRQSYENRPYGASALALHELLYAEGHPYRYQTIGRHEDLQAAGIDDVRGFFRHWYVPSNATLTLAGDFDVAEMKGLVQKWFGGFPLTTRPAHREVPPTPPTAPERTLKDPLVGLRRLEYAWHTPKIYAPGDAELDIAAHALTESGTGRLYKLLVHEKQLAQSVSAYQASTGFSSVFEVSIDLKPEADLALVEQLVQEELARLAATPITERERARAVLAVESSFVWGLEELLARAEALQRYNHYLGHPDGVTFDLDRYRKASPEQVREVVAKYLDPSKKVRLLTLPEEKEKR